MFVSFSAVNIFENCPYSFKLRYIDKVPFDRGSLFSAYGQAMHDTLENYLIKKDISIEKLFKDFFKQELFKLPEKVKRKIFKEKYLKEAASDMTKKGPMLCQMAIDELYNKFPDFKLIGVEFQFVEPITEKFANDYEFKGVIDLIGETPSDGMIRIIDWKNTTWGWKARKKNDKMITYQLAYYKHYYGLLHDVDFDKISTHFALIKRTAKKDNVEIFEVKVGERKVRNALKVLNNMLYNVDRNNFPKNKTNCKYCDFHYTQWCDAK